MPTANAALPRRLILVVGGLFVLAVALHLAGIGLLRYFVERELHPALPKGTSIGEVHLNLFSGAIEIDGFELRRDGETRLRAGRLVADVSALRLLTGTVQIQRAELTNAYARIDRLPDGSFDLGLPEFTADPQPPEVDTEPLDLIIDGVAIERVTVDYRDGDLRSTLVLDEAKVSEYSLRSNNQQIDASWRLRWDDRRLDGTVQLTIDGGQIRVAGKLKTDPLDLDRAQALARLEPEIRGDLGFDGDFDWQGDTVDVSGGLRSARLDYAVAGREVTIEDLSAPAFYAQVRLAPEIAVTFKPEQAIVAKSWAWRAAGESATSRDVVVRGDIHFDTDKQARVEGFSYAATALAWRAGPQAADLTDLNASGRLSQDLTGTQALPQANLQFTAGSLRFVDTDAALDASVNTLAIDGLALGEQDANGARALAGRLTLGRGSAVQGDQKIGWSTIDTALKGKVSTNSARLNVDTEAQQLSLAADALPHGPMTIGGLRLTNLRVAGEETAVEAIRVSGLALPGGLPETRLDIDGIDVTRVAYAPNKGAEVGGVVFDGLRTAVIRDETGVWQHVMTTVDSANPGSGQAASGTPSGDGLPWRVGEVRITGDSHVTIADTINPDMQALRYQIENARVGSLDSQQPDADTPFNLLLRPDRYAEFQIEGVVKPLADQLFLDAEGHLHGFGLTSVNGLIANDLGHRFLEGQIDNDFSIKIASEHLDMGNQLSLATLDVEELPDKQGPPLGTAIALLEDRDGNIKLEVPVSGDLTDPDFKVLGALNPIIMKAVAGAAALAIQPFGSVLLVGSLLADQALKVTFDPAVFDPGELQLDASARDYLDQLSAKLKDKPKLGVRVCGIYAAIERQKNKKGEFTDQPEDLLILAQQRADAVRQYMQGRGVGPKQLRNCRPALDPEIDGLPRVDIRF